MAEEFIVSQLMIMRVDGGWSFHDVGSRQGNLPSMEIAHLGPAMRRMSVPLWSNDLLHLGFHHLLRSRSRVCLRDEFDSSAWDWLVSIANPSLMVDMLAFNGCSYCAHHVISFSKTVNDLGHIYDIWGNCQPGCY